jgi:hypothetical protein
MHAAVSASTSQILEHTAFFFVFLRDPLMRRSVVPPTQAELPVPLAPFPLIANFRVLLVLAGALLHT